MRHNLDKVDFITEEEYLAREALADEKHEYLNGFVYRLHTCTITNMAGASDAHVKVTGNAHYALKTYLRGSPCSLYMSDMRLKIDSKDKAWFYPDVMVSTKMLFLIDMSFPRCFTVGQWLMILTFVIAVMAHRPEHT